MELTISFSEGVRHVLEERAKARGQDMKTFVENLLQITATRSVDELAGPALAIDAELLDDNTQRQPAYIEEGVTMRTSILAETDPDLAQAGAALERAARDARRLADQTDTPFHVIIDGQVVDLRKLERETASESAVELNRPEPSSVQR